MRIILRILESSIPTGISRGPPGVAAPGFSSFWGSIVNRTVFLVDGFNLHHSLRWLDLTALCSSLVHALPGRCEVAGIVCFSALARHMEASRPDTVVRLMKLAAAGTCDRVLVVSGDTDLVPAISEARSTWTARIGVAFPARRANAQLRAVADWTINLDAGTYARHQFPSVVTGRDGALIRRPSGW